MNFFLKFILALKVSDSMDDIETVITAEISLLEKPLCICKISAILWFFANDCVAREEVLGMWSFTSTTGAKS